MAVQIRPVSPAVQKAIYFYLAEIKKMDPDMIIETEDWCMHFKNKNEVNLFYFTFSDPLSFRIKEHSEDSTYEFMAEDTTKNRRIILDRLRALIFESYMNRNGLVAKMNASMRTFILKAMELNEISHYEDQDDAFICYVGDIQIFKITERKEDKKLILTMPQHLFKLDENVYQSYVFESDNYDDMKEHIMYSTIFYRNYKYEEIIPILQKVRDFLKFTYVGQYREANNSHVITFNGENRDVLEFRVKKSGVLNISYFINNELLNKAYNKNNLSRLYELLEDEFYNIGHKIQDAFFEGQTKLYDELCNKLLEFDKHIIIENIDRGIIFKVDHHDNMIFAQIGRNKNLENIITINENIIPFEYDNKDEILNAIFDLLIPIDPRVQKISDAIEVIYNDENPHEGNLNDAQTILEEFDSLHYLLKEKSQNVRNRIVDTINLITKFIEDKKKADEALAIQNESYGRLLKKLNDLYLVIDELKIRVKVLEEKVDELELKERNREENQKELN